MPWSKLKNIIILLLVVTNLSLLAIALSQSIRDSRLRTQARDNAIQFLRDRGIQVEDAAVPQDAALPLQTAQRDLAGEERAAQALLGGEVTVRHRGGEVYRYENENGAVQFHSDGAFSAQLEPEAFPTGEDRVAACARLLEAVGCQGALLKEEGDSLLFGQSWQGAPLFNQQVTAVCREGGVESLSGRRLVGQPREDAGGRTITVATALVNFLNGVSALGDVCNRIDGIQPGYVTAGSLSGSMSLTPVWRVTTDTGAYLLDMSAGTVSRAA